MKHAFKKIIAMLLVIMMVVGILPSALAADYVDGQFSDVSETDWFAPYVEYVFENGLMNGTEAGFSPNGTTTRAQAVVVLHRMSGEGAPDGSSFSDLEADWYKDAVAWAEFRGIVDGVEPGIFRPNGKLTRAQLVTMVWRYAYEPVVTEDYLSEFSDAADVPAWATKAFNWAISVGIIGGSDGKLIPNNSATRAQYAKIITVFHIYINPCDPCTWDEGVVTKPATCTEEGEALFTCTRCGSTKTEVLPIVPCNYVEGVCTMCGDKIHEDGGIVIYYTNDVHTYIDGALSYDNIADLKAQTAYLADGVLLLDAGDHIQGTAYGSMDKGAAIISMMNAAGYDYATLGNHEFDYGMARALEIAKEEADFEYLSANFYNEKDGVAGDPVLAPYAIAEFNGKKVAIIGITTPETFTKSTPKYFQDENGNYIYGIAGGEDGAALYASVQAAIDEVKGEVDYVIALGHLGDDPASDPWNSEDLIVNTTGLDAFIDGHSHSTVEGKEVADKDGNTVILTSTGEYFDAIGKMTITADGIKTELISDYAGSDADVAALKEEHMAWVDGQLETVVAKSEIDLIISDETGRLIRKQETNLGDFTADALYYLFDVTEGLDVDVAIMNGGGIRANLPAGDVSYKTTKTVHTFGNVACLQTITGQQLLDALEWGAKNVGTGENGGFLQVSGITYEIHSYIPSTVQADDKGVWAGAPTGEYRVKNVMVGGEPLDLTAKYNLAGYNYTLRDLGDGFAMFAGAVNVKDYVMEDYLVLANYAQSFEKVDGVPTIKADSIYGDKNGEGRITIIPELKTPFVLSSEIKDGDKVVIYNPGHQMAIKNETDNDWYLIPEAVEVKDNEIADPDASIVWTVVDNGDGTCSFVNGENKIMCWVSGTYMELTNNAAYPEADGNWKIISADEATSQFVIQHATFSSSYGPAYIECYYNANKDKTNIAGYTSSDPFSKLNDFGFQFYVQGGVQCDHAWGEGVETAAPTCTEEGVLTYTCTKCNATKTEPIAALGHIDEDGDGICDICGDGGKTTFALSTELNDGDEVIIVCAAKNIALSAEYGGYYNNGVAVTPVNNEISNPDASIVWTVGKDGENYTFSYGGQKIAMGASYSSMPLGEVNDQWKLVAAATEGAYYIFNVGREVYMEWYEANGYWSGYYNNSTEELFAMNFYVKGEGQQPHVHAWDEGVIDPAATCGKDGLKTFTCTDCGETKTEVIPATGEHTFGDDNVCDVCGYEKTEGGAYALTTELKEADELLIYYPAGQMVLGNTLDGNKVPGVAATPVDNKLSAPEGAGIFTVEYVDGTNFLLKLADGTYLTTGATGNSMSLEATPNEYSQWYLEVKADTDIVYVRSTNAMYNESAGKNQALEYFNGFTTYGWKDNSYYEFQLYVKTEGEIDPPCTHSWDEGKVTKAASCTEVGEMTFTCVLCEATKVEEIAATGHNYVDNTCTNCGDVIVPSAEKTYEKVTVAPTDWSGEYIIVYEAGSVIMDGSLEKLDVSGGTQAVTITDNKITVDSKYSFIIAAVEGGYSIKSASGIYMGKENGTSNGMDESAESFFVNTLGLDAEGNADIISAGGAYLRFNSSSNQLRFRYYKASSYANQKPIALYKLVEG